MTTLCGQQDYLIEKMFFHNVDTQKVVPLCVS